MANDNTTCLIPGCSTGLGRGFAEEALQRGYNVDVTARGQVAGPR